MTALVLQILSYVLPLVIGYLLRHYNVNIPLLPSAPAPGTPADPTVTPALPPVPGDDHVGLLQRVLSIGEAEAKILLKAALQDVLQKGLSDLKNAAANQPQAPKA